MLLFACGILIYTWHTKQIVIRTQNGIDFSITLIIVFGVLSIILIYFIKKLRLFGIGILFFISSLLILTFFSINKASIEGNYIRYPQTGMLTVYNKEISYFSTIDIGNSKLRNKVEVDRCFEFDSVDVKVIDGLFGFKYFTNETKISDGIKCPKNITNSKINPYKYGIMLVKKRCFKLAKNHYSTLIESDSTNDEWLYYRGLIYLFTDEYELALSDFLLGATIHFNQKDSFQKININELITDLTENFESKKFNNSIIKDIMTLENYGHSSDYLERIRYCVLKMKSA